MKFRFAFALCAAAPTVALADITATYRAEGGLDMSMKVQLADNGDMRVDMEMKIDRDAGAGMSPSAGWTAMSMIARGGRTYYVLQRPEGTIVNDVEDVSAVIQEEMAKAEIDMCKEAAAGGAPPKLRPMGTVTVAGRAGEAYGTGIRMAGDADLVISRDPALAPLGAAMAAQFRASSTAMGPCPLPGTAEMQAIFESETPLKLGPMRLETVEFGPIDPARFVLPAAPSTREEVRAEMARKSGSSVTVEIRPPK
jgi:hypothetical protein